MQSILIAAALVATAGLSAAAPAEVYQRSTFQIEQVEHGKVLKSGPLAMMKAYNKYAKVGAQAPSDVVAAAAAVQSGSVTANPESVCCLASFVLPRTLTNIAQYDASYLSPVKVGGQTLMLDFDTGSADL